MGHWNRQAALAALCALVTGCASVSGGNVQTMAVQVRAPDGKAMSDVDCALSNDKGTWLVRAPGSTSIVRSNKDMQVKCEKSPLPAGVVSVESGTRGAMYGNILLGGVVGAVIDHSSGAAYEYPEIVNVTLGQVVAMKWKPALTGGAQAGATGFASLDDVDALPSGARAKDAYRNFLTRSKPRAFALSTSGGHFGWANGTNPYNLSAPDPSQRALESCQRMAAMPCKLYAVDDSVVWVRDTTVSAPASVTPPSEGREVVQEGTTYIGSMRCGPYEGTGHVEFPGAWVAPARMMIRGGQATMERGDGKYSESLSGRVAGSVMGLQGRGAMNATPN
ncbi:MAG: hypothetical protein ACXVXI_10195, partial [Mycobacteriaceae bacterium]